MQSKYTAPLSKIEANQILNKMNRDQRSFIESFISLNKKRRWIEILAHHKGITLPEKSSLEEAENILSDWALKEINDSGYGNRKYICECGQSLRHQYLFYHEKQDKTLSLGRTCIKKYTPLSIDIVAELEQGDRDINLERDEMLIEWAKGKRDFLTPYKNIIPHEIMRQNLLGIPLIERQWEYIRKLQDEFEKKKAEEEQVHYYNQLSAKQKAWIDYTYTYDQKREIISLLRPNKNYGSFNIEELKAAGVPERIIKHITFELPLMSVDKTAIKYCLDLHSQILNQPEPEPVTSAVEREVLDYKFVVQNYGEKLNIIKKRQKLIPKKQISDWNYIQNALFSLQQGKEIDFQSFFKKVDNLVDTIDIPSKL